jgi:MraZ protein
MFRGTSSHTIDDKGRIILPARFREAIPGDEKKIVVTEWQGAIYAYIHDEWDKIEKNALSARKTPTIQNFIRFFIGGANFITLDRQDRFLIPSDLRKAAGLEKEIVLVGSLTRFEIWSKENLEREKQKMEDLLEHEDNQREIDDIGI